VLLIAAHKTPSLVPRPTSPFIFHFALTLVHRSRREAKNGEGQGALCEWHQVDWGGYGGGGAHSQFSMSWISSSSNNKSARFEHFTRL